MPDSGAVAKIGTQPEPAPENEEVFGQKRRLLRNEAYREARRRHRTLALTRGYFDLARVLGISQKDADRLVALLVEQELQSLDRPNFNPRNEKELRIREHEIQQGRLERNAEIAALIGADKLPKWEQYEASLDIRHEVRQMAASVFAPVESLSENQSEALIRVMHTERQRVRQELSEFSESLVWSGGMEGQSHIYRLERYAGLMEAANERVHAAASSFLSPGQLAALDQRLRSENELQQAEFEETRAMLEAQDISDDVANSAARRSRQP